MVKQMSHIYMKNVISVKKKFNIGIIENCGLVVIGTDILFGILHNMEIKLRSINVEIDLIIH